MKQAVFARARRAVLAAGCSALAASAVPSAWSQGVSATDSYPSRPVKLLVPYPAGGGAADMAARTVAVELAKLWGQPVVVENRPGASGMLGNEIAVKSPADGYTLLLGITTLIQQPFLYAKLPYDAKKDLAPVSQIGTARNLFVVASDVPADSLKAFAALTRSQPGKFSFGSFGNGSTSHIQGELFKRQASLDSIHVPYNGSAPLINAILGGQVSSSFIDIGTAQPHLKSGRFKALAVTGEQRLRSLPDVPTFKELGYAGFEPYGWWGLFVPAATPRPIVDKVSADVARVMRMPEVVSRFEGLSLQAIGNSADDFARVMARDSPLWEQAIRSANIKID